MSSKKVSPSKESTSVSTPTSTSSSSSSKLRRATYVKVKDLTPGSKGHNLVVKVLSVGEVTEKKRYDDSNTQLVEAVVGDETGIVTFSAKNDQVGFFQVGKVLVLRNSNASIFNGFMRLNVTQWGKIAVHPDGIASTPKAPTNIKKENDLSAVEYELVTVEENEEDDDGVQLDE